MITKESIFSKKNQGQALQFLKNKKNNAAEQENITIFWEANKSRIIEDVYNKKFTPGIMQEYEIVSGKGKRRNVARMNTEDRILTRLLAQKLNSFYNPLFLDRSFAYQENKGTLQAAERARDYIEHGNEYVVEIDIKSYFDSINLEKMMEILGRQITDDVVLDIISKYLYCSASCDGEVYKKKKGLVQGSAMSPVLSNVYLNDLDLYMDDAKYNWIRFADNIYIYVPSVEEGKLIYADLLGQLKSEYGLTANEQKSGIFSVYECRMLGFEFIKKDEHVYVQKHSYEPQTCYTQWHPSVVEKAEKEYHIIQNGTLNKKDYALLFENEDEKHHLPVETTDQINIYNDVTLTSAALRTLCAENVRLGLYNKHGNLMGYFVPTGYTSDAKLLLRQCKMYNDNRERLRIACKMEKAAIHNLRANVRYYKKNGTEGLEFIMDELDHGIKRMGECKTVDELLLTEARCREIYYQMFNFCIRQPGFAFNKRTRQPPEDNINAIISFGNTLLYNRIQQLIWHTSLDSRIGVFHAANRRSYSLNLDFADIYKPIIVDRVIFKLINRGQLTVLDFVKKDNGGVYLNDRGKRLFVEAFNEKMRDRITVDDEKITYEQLIERDIYGYIRYLCDDEKFRPYKYY